MEDDDDDGNALLNPPPTPATATVMFFFGRRDATLLLRLVPNMTYFVSQPGVYLLFLSFFLLCVCRYIYVV